MSQPACNVRLPYALKSITVNCLVCLILGVVLALSGCGPGFQEGINQLNGIIALSASDAWAVGWASGQGASPLIEHWDGSAWTVVSAPGKGKNSVLDSVAAGSARDVWAVGSFSTPEEGDETLIEHWNGATWQVVPSPNNPGGNELGAVAVVSATDVWAVGTTTPCSPFVPLPIKPISQPDNALAYVRPASRSSLCLAPPRPLIEHWDGTAWSIVSNSFVPDPDTISAALSSVVAFGPNDVWATGAFFDRRPRTANGTAVVEHWDGKTWQVVHEVVTALVGRPWATAFFSSNDQWAIVYTTTSGGPSASPIIKHWNGTTWSVVDDLSFDASDYFVETMAASGPDDLWAAGEYPGVVQSCCLDQVFTLHWNGSTWSLIPCPSPEAAITVTASASRSPTDAWMVGYYDSANNTQLTFLEHWDGRAWRLVPNPDPGAPTPAEP